MTYTTIFKPCWKCRRCDKPIPKPIMNKTGFCSMCYHILQIRERRYNNQIAKLTKEQGV